MFFSFLVKYFFSKRAGALVRLVSLICVMGLAISLAGLTLVMSIMSGFGKSIERRLLKDRPHLVVLSENKITEIKKILKPKSEILSIRPFEKQDLIIKTEEGLFSTAVGRGYKKEHLKKRLSFDLTEPKNSKIRWDLDKGRSAPAEAPRASGFQDSPENPHEDPAPLPLTREGGIGGLGRQKTARSAPAEAPRASGFQDSSENPPFPLKGKGGYRKKGGGASPPALPLIDISSDIAAPLFAVEGSLLTLLPAESLLLPPGEIPPYASVKVRSWMDSGHFSTQIRDLFYEIGSLTQLKNTASLTSGVEIFLKKPRQYALYQKQLEDHGFKVQSWADRHSSVLFALKIERWMMAVFLFIAALIASFSISSVVSSLTMQKQKDIGILTVMGFPIKKIKNLFIHLAFSMALLGSILGAALGFGLSLFIQSFGSALSLGLGLLLSLLTRQDPLEFLPWEIYQDQVIPVEIHPEMFVVVFLGAAGLSYLASWLCVHSQTFSNEILKKAA